MPETLSSHCKSQASQPPTPTLPHLIYSNLHIGQDPTSLQSDALGDLLGDNFQVNQTFKIQFLLKFFIELFSVELGICTLKIKVTFKLDCVFLNISWTVLPSGTISCSPIAYVGKKKKKPGWLNSPT